MSITLKQILVTGGTGYIGSHTVLELLNSKKYFVTVIDNLCNSSTESLNRVKNITQSQNVEFQEIDLLDYNALEKLFEEQKSKQKQFEAVIHFAGLKAVGESVRQPLRYYRNNVSGTINLLKIMDTYGVRNLVFSSSATVYGDPSPKDPTKITEDYPLKTTNPYGATKLQIEDICRDLAKSKVGTKERWKIILLRYFNPIGAHSSGLIGEDPKGIPNNLAPYILQVAVGKRPHLNVFGNTYKTVDGTGVRDYIHVVDLANGHLAAIEEGIFGDALEEDCEAFNLGTGVGTSVLQMLKGFSAACGKELKHKIAEKRPGDVASVAAAVTKAETKLKWKAKLSIEQACIDGWNWAKTNPDGYTKVTTTTATTTTTTTITSAT